eukprot:g22984.t1
MLHPYAARATLAVQEPWTLAPADLQLIVLPYARPTDEQQLQLRRAVEEGLDMELEELLEVPIHPDYEMEDKYKPLWISCAEGHYDCAQVLLEAKANINKACDLGHSPLWVACERGHMDVARLLLDHGADKDQRCLGGNRRASAVSCCAACPWRGDDTFRPIVGARAGSPVRWFRPRAISRQAP